MLPAVRFSVDAMRIVPRHAHNEFLWGSASTRGCVRLCFIFFRSFHLGLPCPGLGLLALVAADKHNRKDCGVAQLQQILSASARRLAAEVCTIAHASYVTLRPEASMDGSKPWELWYSLSLLCCLMFVPFKLSGDSLFGWSTTLDRLGGLVTSSELL